MKPKVLKPADGRRLEALYHRCRALRSVGVSAIRPEYLEALCRVVDVLLYDERRATRIKAAEELPPDWGRVE